MNEFIKSGGKITAIATALGKLGAAFKKLNSATQGGGLLQKGLRFIGVGGAPKQSPIAKTSGNSITCKNSFTLIRPL